MTAEQGKKLQPGDVVQINPARFSGAFESCLVTVTGIGPQGIQGFVWIPDGAMATPPRQAFVQLGWFQIEYVGRAHFNANYVREM